MKSPLFCHKPLIKLSESLSLKTPLSTEVWLSAAAPLCFKDNKENASVAKLAKTTLGRSFLVYDQQFPSPEVLLALLGSITVVAL